MPNGVNLDGYEDGIASGGTAGFYGWSDNGYGDSFNVTAMQAWKPKIVRMCLCASTILGTKYTYGATGVSNSSGQQYASGETQSSFFTKLDAQIALVQGIGARVILSIRNNMPNLSDGGPGYPDWQNQMADADTCIPAWQVLAERYGSPGGTATQLSLGGISFDLYNEPVMVDGPSNIYSGGINNSDTNQIWGTIYGSVASGYKDAYLTQWTDVTTGNGNPYRSIGLTKQVACHQTVINAIRAKNANNVIYMSGPNYTNPGNPNPAWGGWSFLVNNQSYLPVDTLPVPQLAISWHPYEQNSVFPQGTQGGGLWQQFCQLNEILPCLILETGDPSYGSSQLANGQNFTQAVTGWSDLNGIGVIFWSFQTEGYPILLADTGNDATGTAGYGTYVKSWLTK